MIFKIKSNKEPNISVFNKVNGRFLKFNNGFIETENEGDAKYLVDAGYELVEGSFKPNPVVENTKPVKRTKASKLESDLGIE